MFKKKSFELLPSSVSDSESKERTIQSILENVKIVEDNFQECPAYEKIHKKRLEFAKKMEALSFHQFGRFKLVLLYLCNILL